MRSHGSGATFCCSRASSSHHAGGKRSTLVAASCPSLTYTPPADSSTRRRRIGWASRSSRSRGDKEPLAAGDAHQLPIATDDGDAAAHRADRPRRHDQAGPLADGQAARAGQEVEEHRHGHRRRDPDRPEVQGQPVGAPVPTRGAEHHQHGDAPAGDAGHQGADPPSPHAEQAQRDDRHDGGTGDRSDDADDVLHATTVGPGADAALTRLRSRAVHTAPTAPKRVAAYGRPGLEVSQGSDPVATARASGLGRPFQAG